MFLLRHGKSDWAAEYENDHERPLNKRGRRSARAIGAFMAQARMVPDSAVTSTAVRARGTLERAMKSGEWRCPVRKAAELYDGDVRQVLSAIAQEDSSTTSLLLVGHEPALSQMVGVLTGGGSVALPTAALVRFDITGMWSEIGPGRGELTGLITPRMLLE